MTLVSKYGSEHHHGYRKCVLASTRENRDNICNIEEMVCNLSLRQRWLPLLGLHFSGVAVYISLLWSLAFLSLFLK